MQYLVEAYLPEAASAGLADAASAAMRAAHEVTGTGRAVRYVRAIFVPGDETCFHLYEAASTDAVAEAARRAGIESERIVEAVHLGGDSPTGGKSS